MPPPLTIDEQLRRSMLGREAWSVVRLAEALPKLLAASGIIAPALLPIFAFYVVEAHDSIFDFTGRRLPVDAMRDDGVLARSLRAHMKVNEENDGRPGLLALLRECEAKSTEWFNRPHRGILQQWKRWIQPDLGIYFVDDDVVSFTHLTLAALSLGALDEMDRHDEPLTQIGPRSQDFARDVISFVATLARAFPNYEEAPVPTPRIVTGDRDCKAEGFYRDIGAAMGITRAHAPALVTTIAKVNVARRVLSALLPPTSDFLLRKRILTAHYAVQRVSHLNGEGVAAASRIRRLGMAIARNGGRALRQMVTERLRGDLAHYGVEALLRRRPVAQAPASLLFQPGLSAAS